MPTRSTGFLSIITALALAALLTLALGPGPASAGPAPDDEGVTTAEPRRGSDSRYRYAATYQHFSDGLRGAAASFTVHKPKQVDWRNRSHSLVEMALVANRKRSQAIIEVGWRRGVPHGNVRLFVFRWDNKKRPTCYNACGFVRKGKGWKPGRALRPGTTIRTRWVHKNRRWNLYINGKRSGYYPDRLWNGRFKKADTLQLFGEVHRPRSNRCIDMGNGRPARKAKAAKVTNVRAVGSTPVHLLRQTPGKGYGVKMLSRKSFRYGGPGPC